MSASVTFAERAEILIRRRVPVVPVNPGTKKCTLLEWDKLATTDSGQIEAWNRKNPAYNTGAVGKKNGCLILDIDDSVIYEQLLLAGVNLDEIRTFKVAGQKQPPCGHYYFQQTAASNALANCDLRIMSRETGKKLRTLFDVKGNNAYVVGPHSIHPDGMEYTIVEDSPIVPIPDALVVLLATHKGTIWEGEGKYGPKDQKGSKSNGRARSSRQGRLKERVEDILTNCLGRGYEEVKSFIAKYGYYHRHQADSAIANYLFVKHSGDYDKAAREFERVRLHWEREENYNRLTLGKAKEWYDAGWREDDSERKKREMKSHAERQSKPNRSAPENAGKHARPGDFPRIEELMVLTEAGKPRAIVANAIAVLQYSPESAGVLAYNEFAQLTVIKKPTPWPKTMGSPWSDADDIRAAEWLQRMPGNGVFVSPQIAAQAVEAIAHQNSFHPVRDYLLSLAWDGTPRLDTWLVAYFGVKDTRFARAAGAAWLKSAIARVFRPGCQADHTLLLEGPQGIRKSSGLRVLTGDEWFTDHLSALGSKDSRGDLLGKWVIEVSELGAIRRAPDIETVKAFLTAGVDHFRKPYGRRSEDVPRQCVFAATTNDETPFHDETGNRRFWPLRCGKIDVDGLSQGRNQLWAEAYRRYQERPIWWLEDAKVERSARQEQDKRYEPGPWDDEIMEWVEELRQRNDEKGVPIPISSDRDRVTTIDILVHAIGKQLERITVGDTHLVARCLTHYGWKSRQERKRGERYGKRFYVRPSGRGLGRKKDAI